MGDNLSDPRLADFQPIQQPTHIAPTIDDEPGPGSPAINGEDEPYTIKCICGFDDDTFDGSTVFCERCDTWQHIACYYGRPNLPDEFEHSCIDCNPSQRVDPIAARQRQEALRIPEDAEDDRRIKKPTKTHKKSRVRDLNNAAHLANGNASLQPFGNSQRSTSPREQGPPPKRPKISHRSHNSLTMPSNRPSSNRARTNSGAPLNFPDPPNLPLSQCPPDYLSPDFIRVHHENTAFRNAPANLHINIGVTNMLSTWLDDQDAFAKATNGLTHNDVFQHFPQHIEELETPIEKRSKTDTAVSFHGAHPVWPYLTVEKDLMSGHFVGELRGSIGHRDNYISDPANQWDKLRHPDHFVFFHPVLPIYIDSRTDGTLLRYARRSCRPNLNMQTLITGKREYRFCFTANGDIAQGTEITIPWDTKCDQHLQACLGKSLANMHPSDFEYVSEWAGKVLAHFGGCACDVSKSKCLLATFDRRLGSMPHDSNAHTLKNRRRKKPHKITPPNTGNATNSRASSSGPVLVNQNGDVEMEDGRSPSRSTENRTSRDGTPSTTSRQNSTAPNHELLSERDKRKLQQQERLFEQMEQDNQGNRKKKRASGSAVQTPAAVGHSKSANRVNGMLSTPQTPAPGQKNRTADGDPPYVSAGMQTPSISDLQNGTPLTVGEALLLRRLQPAKPIYANASTQTNNDAGKRSLPAPRTQRRFLTPHQRILSLSLLHRYRQSQRSAGDAARCSAAHSPTRQPDLAPTIGNSPHLNNAKVEEEDTAMDTSLPLATEELKISSAIPENRSEMASAPVTSEQGPSNPTSSPPMIKQSESPVNGTKVDSTLHNEEMDQQREERGPAAQMHVDLPPPPVFPRPALGTSLTSTTTPEVLPTSTSYSPDNTGQSARPSTVMTTGSANESTLGLTRPSPVKKKMSLSDYMSKRKAETPVVEKSQIQVSPGALDAATGEATLEPKGSVE